MSLQISNLENIKICIHEVIIRSCKDKVKSQFTGSDYI